MFPSSNPTHWHGSGQTHASNNLYQYLASTHSSFSSLDSVESEYEELPSANAHDPEWYNELLQIEFMLCYNLASPADYTSVSETSGSVREDLTSGMTVTPLLTLSSNSIYGSTDSRDTNNGGLYTRFDSTGFDSDLAVDRRSNSLNSQWNTTEPALPLGADSHSGSASSVDLNRFSPDYSTPAQNDEAPKLPVPRLHTSECPTCYRPFTSQYQLREHVKKSHQSFICNDCCTIFKYNKDLKRHQNTEKAACSCGKKYARHDGLLRHIANLPGEAGRHRAAELSSK